MNKLKLFTFSLIILLLIQKTSFCQGTTGQVLTRTNTTAGTTNQSWQGFRMLSPTNLYGSSYVLFEIQYDTIKFYTNVVKITMLNNRLGIIPSKKYISADDSGYLTQKSFDSLLFKQSQILGLQDSFNTRYTKTQSDARYLQSFTELDPIWTAASINYLLSSTAALTYQPILGYTPYNSTNPNGYINSVPAQSFTSLTGKPTTLSGYGITDAYPLIENPSGFISSIPAQSFGSLTGVPTTILGYGITDPILYSAGSYSNPSWMTSLDNSKITGLGSAALTASSSYATAAQGILASTALQPTGSAASLTSFPILNQNTTGNSGTSTKLATSRTINGISFDGTANITVTDATKLTIPTGTTSQVVLGNGTLGVLPVIVTPTYNYGVTRPINSTAFTPSSTQPYRVYYSVDISCTASIGGNASGSVILQYFNGSSWINTGGGIKNSNSVSLALTLNSITLASGTISGEFPSNTQLRLVSTTSGTTTITYNTGQEVLY